MDLCFCVAWLSRPLGVHVLLHDAIKPADNIADKALFQDLPITSAMILL